MTETIRRLTDLTPEHIQQLSDVLIDCVQGGASIGFMAALTRDDAQRFWSQIAGDVQQGSRILLVAQDERAQIVGTVHLALAALPNQPHRADLSKLMVRRDGAALCA